MLLKVKLFVVSVKMGSQVKTVQFSHFMAVALGLYKTMGIDTFTSQVKYGTLDRFIQVVILHLGTWNLILIIIGEIIYLLKSFGSFENFLQITAVLPCIGLCVGSMGKILTVWNKKTQVKTILSQLEGIFPRNLVEQEKFQVETYRKHITKMIIPLTVVTMFALCSICMNYSIHLFITFATGSSKKCILILFGILLMIRVTSPIH